VTTMKEAAQEFLSHKRVAVTGVSRNPKNHGSNVVYKRLRRIRKRVARGGELGSPAWRDGHLRRMSVHVRPHGRSGSQGAPCDVHNDRRRSPPRRMNRSNAGSPEAARR